MTPWFLDTNVCIDLLRGKASASRLPTGQRCKLSSIVWAELWVGAAKNANPERGRLRMEASPELFDLVPFDGEAAKHYGEIRAQLERGGPPIGPLDQLIAAHARSAGATLLTGNLKEFKRVPDLKCHAWE